MKQVTAHMDNHNLYYALPNFAESPSTNFRPLEKINDMLSCLPPKSIGRVASHIVQKTSRPKNKNKNNQTNKNKNKTKQNYHT